MVEEVLLVHAKVVIEEEEELPLAEVDFGKGEGVGVASPVLALGGGVWETRREKVSSALVARLVDEGLTI